MDYTEKYLKYKNKYSAAKKKQNEEMNLRGGGRNNSKLILFKAAWCSHCVKFEPTWNSIQQNKNNNVQYVTYDANNDSEAIRKYNITGYPTLLLSKNNKLVEYVGNRTIDGIQDFIKSYN